MDIKGSIRSAEQKFKQDLEEFFTSVYDDDALPSHGLNHHRRVWKYAVALILEAENHNKIDNTDLPSGLIIASYLHDIGLSVEPGVKHGSHSKEISRRFLRENQLDENDFPGMLQAIENHDNKEYLNFSGQLDMLTILSIADDLDAFGFTGIFRYLEIYFLRGTDPKEIGTAIRKNALSRFNHFVKAFNFSTSLITEQKKRFEILDNFCIEYDKEVTSYKFGSSSPKGYCGIAEAVKNSVPFTDSFGLPIIKNIQDPVLNWFTEGLASEINS